MNKYLGTVDGVLNFYCLRPDHIDVYDEHVLRSAYDALAARLTNRTAELVAVQARLAEALECCTIKDNRNLRLEAQLERAKRVLLPLALSAIESTGQYLATQDAIREFLQIAGSADNSLRPRPDPVNDRIRAVDAAADRESVSHE
jgi:hypothetical protein